MKYTLLFMIALAVMIPLTMVDGKKHGGKDDGKKGRDPPGGIPSCINGAIKGNNKLLKIIIEALNKAGLTQYVIANKTLNMTKIEQDLIIILPKIKDFLYTYVVPEYPKLNATINAALSVLNDLQNNQTTQTIFGAFLLLTNYEKNKIFVKSIAAQNPTLTVDYLAMLKTPSSAKQLIRYFSVLVRRKVKGDTMGPWGKFKDSDHDLRI